MYLHNKYTIWYYNIINRAKNRTLTGYKERHHIIPKSLRGADTKENLVDLTAKEHYICHGLLCKMTEGRARSKLTLALLKMCVVSKTHKNERVKLSGIRYEQIRQAAGKANSGVNSPTYGRKRTPDEEARRLASWKKTTSIHGPYFHTSETKAKISKSKKGKPRPEHVKAIMYENLKKGFGRDNNSGKQYYNNGIKNYLGYECPVGYVLGKLQKQQTNYSNGTKWFNDGKKNYRATICPPGCIPGLLKNFN